MLTLFKLETGADTDDADPYVCFRRREVRQVRKTRGRDAHSAEKLKKLRKELEESRGLLSLIRSRESTKQDQLATERQLFEQRTNLRQVKLNLPDQYKDGDDDLLINQKVNVTIQVWKSCSILTHEMAEEEVLRHSTWIWQSNELIPKIRW